MKYKVIIQLSTDAQEVIQSTTVQILNLLQALENNVEVELVCHGSSINFVINSNNQYSAALQKLLAHNIKIYACNNMLLANKKNKSDVYEGIKIVPSAIAEIVIKQQQGWSYIKAGI